MSLITIIIIAVGLAMDAFAVSIVTGSAYKKPRTNHALRIALAFGIFQALMPLLGWLIGSGVKGYIEGYDHWIAFILLCLVGGKMIYESFKIKKAEDKSLPITTAMLLVLAIATSIDALAVGFTFSFLLAGSLITALIIIGTVTFTLSYAGFYIGKFIGHFFENAIEAIGGIILIAIAVKILLQHML